MEGEPGHDIFQEVDDTWNFSLHIKVLDQIEDQHQYIELLAEHDFDNKISFENCFTIEQLQNMGLKKLKNLEKLQDMLIEARDGSADSRLTYTFRDQNLIICLHWTSLIGELEFEFSLEQNFILGNYGDNNVQIDPHSWQMERVQLIDRVRHLECEVSSLKEQMEGMKKMMEEMQIEKMRRNSLNELLFGRASEAYENDAYFEKRHAEDRYLMEQYPGHRRNISHLRRGAVQLDANLVVNSEPHSQSQKQPHFSPSSSPSSSSVRTRDHEKKDSNHSLPSSVYQQIYNLTHPVHNV